jgi:crotonobetaine/carnitine-CoA ligase
MSGSDSRSARGAGAGARLSIPGLLESALRKRGADHIAFDYSGSLHTLGQLDRDTSSAAAGLAQLGVGSGDTVASLLNSCWEQLLLLLACGKLGAICVPINTAYKGDILLHQLSDSQAKLLVASSEFLDRIRSIASALPRHAHLVYVGPPPEQPIGAISHRPFSELMLDAGDFVPARVRPDDLALLLYTSGTTGPSKGCMISHNYICNMARQVTTLHYLREDDVIWTPLPAFHVSQLCTAVLPTLMLGARASICPRFSLSNFWPQIERSRATAASIVASMITQVADAPDSDAAKRCFGQLRVVMGVPFTARLVNHWRERFGIKHAGSPGYGLTECAAITTAMVDDKRPPGSAGRQNDDFEVRIFDDDDNELAPGVAGEIVVRPRKPHVMFEGYWKQPESTLRQMRNMWFHTGDIGKFDEAGFFYFVDRKKDYLRRRGENISSFEMETILRGHDALLETALHAVPSDQGEDDVKLTAMLKEGATLTEEELCRWCIERFPYFAVPRYIEFRRELPKNPVGRVLKYQLRDEGVTPTTWDRERSGVVVPRR